MMPFSNFTPKAQEIIKKAHELAMERGQNQIDAVYLLAAIIFQDDGIVISILEKLGVDINVLSDSLLEEMDESGKSAFMMAAPQLYLAPDLGRSLEAAFRAAQALGVNYISPEHLLLGILDTPSKAKELLMRHRVDKEAVMGILKTISGEEKIHDMPQEKKFRNLEKYSRNLTKLAREDKLDPVIGREEEIRRIMQILSRRTKNNPVLIGEAGGGKTRRY